MRLWVRTYDAIDIPAVPDASAQPKTFSSARRTRLTPRQSPYGDDHRARRARRRSRFATASSHVQQSPTAGVTFTNMPFPLWGSTKRFNLVVVDAIAAADPETRRKINELLARMVRTVSTWNIVQEDPLNPVLPGRLPGVGPLGYQTIGSVAIPPDDPLQTVTTTMGILRVLDEDAARLAQIEIDVNLLRAALGLPPFPGGDIISGCVQVRPQCHHEWARRREHGKLHSRIVHRGFAVYVR